MPSEVIGNLVAVVTADTAGFQSGMKAVAKATGEVDATLQQSTTNFASMFQATKQATGGLLDMIGPLKGLAAGFGAAQIVGGMVDFGKSVLATATEVVAMSDKLGISTTAAQQFKAAAQQTGTSMGTVETAILKMNQALVDPGRGTVDALTAAGLSVRDLRNMNPGEAFLTIAEAIRQIPDPMRQSQVAMELFGKSGAELLPGIKEGFDQIARSADYMSEASVRALKEAQDSWEALGNEATMAGSKIAGAMAQALSEARSMLNVNVSPTLMQLTLLSAGADTVTKSFADQALALRGQSDLLRTLAPPMMSVAEATAAVNRSIAPLIPTIKAATAETAAYTQKVQTLADLYSGTTIRTQIADTAAAVTKLGGAMAMNATQATTLAAQIGKWREQGYTIPPALQKVEAAATAVWAANLKMSDSIKVVTLDLQVLNTNVLPVTQAFKDLQFSVDLSTKGMVGMGVEVNQMSAVQLPKLATTITSMSPFLDQQRAKTAAWGSSLSQLGGIFGQFGGQAGAALGHVADQFGRSIEAGGSFATGMQNFSKFSVQSIGNIASAAQGVMSMINSFQGMTKGQNAPSKWGAAGQGALQGAQVGMMFGPWGAAVGAGVGAIAGFITASSVATKANDVRDDLQAQFGGFAAAQKVIGDFGNDPVLMETYGNFYTAGTSEAVRGNYAAFTDRLKQLTEAREHPPVPSPWDDGFSWEDAPPGWGWQPVETEAPSFQNRPMENVTGAGLAMLHPGDVVGVPPGGAAMLGTLQSIERMMSRQSVELAIAVRSAIQTA